MSILETLEELMDELRGTHTPTRAGINEQTLHAATRYNATLIKHFDAFNNSTEQDASMQDDQEALRQARKEMERLKGDIARLKAQLLEM